MSRLLLVAGLVPAFLLGVMFTFVYLGVVALDCTSCGYPGFTVWGYLADGLALILFFSPFLLWVYFAGQLNLWEKGALLISEVVLYGYAVVVIAGNLSVSPQPSPLTQLITGYETSMVPAGGVALVGCILSSFRKHPKGVIP